MPRQPRPNIGAALAGLAREQPAGELVEGSKHKMEMWIKDACWFHSYCGRVLLLKIAIKLPHRPIGLNCITALHACECGT